ncbi:MAG: DUF547 domain-containing protein [Deltaproteobacteria bacterium]|nr:DUF547 domain-containing protein [Deltaproteobacteria bacterium]MBW2444816.1 DUF547 domain-containing protein [Deltaproteobacteria bacterium]
MIRPSHVAALLLLLGLSGCASTIHPLQLPNPRALPPTEFSHAGLDRVLERFVDEDGLVDYAALGREPFVLGTYLGQLAAYSPVSHPALFANSNARLAYWLNAYNAVALRLVLEHYPITSVRDIEAWWTAALPEGAGFFYGYRFPLGGRSTSLYTLENRIVRRGFPDPRIHFALNCASLGCPVLPRQAFDPARLDEQLAHETRRFLSAARNFRLDEATRTAWLSAIFDGYEGDFTKWQSRRGGDASLLAFVADHAGPEAAAAAARAATEGFTVRFHEHDWRLNDQALGPRPASEASLRP